jgi:hypothetical protein
MDSVMLAPLPPLVVMLHQSPSLRPAQKKLPMFQVRSWLLMPR